MSTTEKGAAALARHELGAFLRRRREALTPTQVGLPAGGRRRTPGLRREEVALLAGVGVTWYTWLEQGRDIRPSRSVLDAVCRALLLGQDERRHVRNLVSGGPGEDTGVDAACKMITAAHLQILADNMPHPACIQSAKFDILASNASYRFLVNDLDDGPVADRNCMVRAFLDPDWQVVYGDHERATARMVARLRASLSDHLNDPSWTALIDRMRTESADFDRLWQRGELAFDGMPVQLFRTQRVGDVSLRFTRLWLQPARGVQLVVLHPDGASDAAAIARLAESVRGEPVVTTRPAVARRLGDHALVA